MTRLKIPYKCVCMQDEGSFEMEPRRDGEDIMDFMERLRSTELKECSPPGP